MTARDEIAGVIAGHRDATYDAHYKAFICICRESLGAGTSDELDARHTSHVAQALVDELGIEEEFGVQHKEWTEECIGLRTAEVIRLVSGDPVVSRLVGRWEVRG